MILQELWDLKVPPYFGVSISRTQRPPVQEAVKVRVTYLGVFQGGLQQESYLLSKDMCDYVMEGFTLQHIVDQLVNKIKDNMKTGGKKNGSRKKT